LKGTIIKGCRPELEKKFKFYLAKAGNIYSHDMVSDEMKFKTTDDG